MGKILSFYTMPHPPIIIPAVGRGEEKKIKKTQIACEAIGDEVKSLKPDAIIIITPHGPFFSDAVALSSGDKIEGNLRRFGAYNEGITVDINLPLTNKIIEYAREDGIECAKIDSLSSKEYNIEYELDHGSIVPLYFINKKYKDYNLVHITYGALSKVQLYKFGMNIKKAVEESGLNAVFIASGDLSHRLKEYGPYEYNENGEKFDKKILYLLEKGDVLGVFTMDEALVKEAGECGLRSYYIMLGAMNKSNIEGKVLSYEGTFGVGYGVMTFKLNKSEKDNLEELINALDSKYKGKESGDVYVTLAKESLTYYLTHGTYMNIPEHLPDNMKNEKNGVFVSLKKEGALRGCIGTIFPSTNSVAQEIIRNAVEAGMYDPRFMPVTEDEIPLIDFSVDVLSNIDKAKIEELDPKVYGIIITSGRKKGVLLPALQGVDTVEEQINIVLKKAGIDKAEDFTIEKFKVVRHI